MILSNRHLISFYHSFIVKSEICKIDSKSVVPFIYIIMNTIFVLSTIVEFVCILLISIISGNTKELM